MENNDKLTARLAELIDRGEELKWGRDDQYGYARDEEHRQQCLGWISAASNISALILIYEDATYRSHLEKMAAEATLNTVNKTVGRMNEVLKNLLVDLEAGLLSSIIDHTRAEVFDDFLDHARAYLGGGRKNESGVIAGVVFEDTVRRIAENRDIEQAGQKLDWIISELAKAGTITSAMAKRARASADVRTKATHAQWDEFETGDVEATIACTDELILQNLDR